jgi:hypothetical protein
MSAVAIGFSNFWGDLISRMAKRPWKTASIFLPSAVTSKPPASSSTGFSSRSARSKYTIGVFVSDEPARGSRRYRSRPFAAFRPA